MASEVADRMVLCLVGAARVRAPGTRQQATWQVELDTYDPASPARPAAADHKAGDHITVGPRSIVVLLAASLAPSDARTVVTGRRSR